MEHKLVLVRMEHMLALERMGCMLVEDILAHMEVGKDGTLVAGMGCKLVGTQARMVRGIQAFHSTGLQCNQSRRTLLRTKTAKR